MRSKRRALVSFTRAKPINTFISILHLLIMEDDDESVIANFVRNNQSLFVVMGIFAAISIYITQIAQGVSESEKYYLGFGVAASLFLFIRFSWIIFV